MKANQLMEHYAKKRDHYESLLSYPVKDDNSPNALIHARKIAYADLESTLWRFERGDFPHSKLVQIINNIIKACNEIIEAYPHHAPYERVKKAIYEEALEAIKS